MALRLNLGCHLWELPREQGWVNIDLYHEGPNVDVKADITALPYPPGCAEMVYAGHVLEHFHGHEAPDLLRHWWSMVAPGGSLAVVIPDVEKGLAWAERGAVTWEWYGMMLDGQFGNGMNHFARYTAASLETLMRDVLGPLDLDRLDPIDCERDGRLVSNIGWQSGWEGFKR